MRSKIRPSSSNEAARAHEAAAASTSSSISGVSFPVNVFCWLGGNAPSRRYGPTVASALCRNFGLGRGVGCPSAASARRIPSHAKAPSATIDRSSGNAAISRSRYGRHRSRSSGGGLFAGGAQRFTAATDTPRSSKPSSRATEVGWLARPHRYIAAYRKSPLRSPVKIRPVRLPPCAAGASPTMAMVAAGSPKPGTGRPQYVWSANLAPLSRAASSRHATRRGHARQTTTSAVMRASSDPDRTVTHRAEKGAGPKPPPLLGAVRRRSAGSADRAVVQVVEVHRVVPVPHRERLRLDVDHVTVVVDERGLRLSWRRDDDRTRPTLNGYSANELVRSPRPRPQRPEAFGCSHEGVEWLDQALDRPEQPLEPDGVVLASEQRRGPIGGGLEAVGALLPLLLQLRAAPGGPARAGAFDPGAVLDEGVVQRASRKARPGKDVGDGGLRRLDRIDDGRERTEGALQLRRQLLPTDHPGSRSPQAPT